MSETRAEEGPERLYVSGGMSCGVWWPASDAAVGTYVSNAQARVSTVAAAESVAKEPEIGKIRGVAEVVE